MTATLESGLTTYRPTDRPTRSLEPSSTLSHVAPRFTAQLYFLEEEGWGLAIDTTEQIGPWLHDVIRRVFYLLKLPEGWDSYGARRISPDAVSEGLQLLGEVLGPGEDIQIPDLTPGPNGEVQLGWHRDRKTLEVDIIGPGDATVYFFDDTNGVADEWEMDLAEVRQRLPNLVRQHFALPR